MLVQTRSSWNRQDKPNRRDDNTRTVSFRLFVELEPPFVRYALGFDTSVPTPAVPLVLGVKCLKDVAWIGNTTERGEDDKV